MYTTHTHDLPVVVWAAVGQFAGEHLPQHGEHALPNILSKNANYIEDKIEGLGNENL